MKLLYWNATTGRGYKRRIRVCSLKFPSMFLDVRNWTIVIRVATSTESTSFPYIRGLNDWIIWSLDCVLKKVSKLLTGCGLLLKLVRAFFCQFHFIHKVLNKNFKCIANLINTWFKWLLRIVCSGSGSTGIGSPCLGPIIFKWINEQNWFFN